MTKAVEPAEQKTIVVIGNGLAGRSAAEALVKCKEVSVVVIESRTFYEEEYFITYAFGPGGAEHYKNITHDSSAVAVPNATYVYGTVLSVSRLLPPSSKVPFGLVRRRATPANDDAAGDPPARGEVASHHAVSCLRDRSQHAVFCLRDRYSLRRQGVRWLVD